MWLPKADFVSLHYTYITLCSILAFIIIYPLGNLEAIDAFFFGVSANTESGLNTVDVKALALYQQLVIYFFPIITNLGFINIVVVIVRLWYFEKRFRSVRDEATAKEDSTLSSRPRWLSALKHTGNRTHHDGPADLEDVPRTQPETWFVRRERDMAVGERNSVQISASQHDNDDSNRIVWADNVGSARHLKSLQLADDHEKRQVMRAEQDDNHHLGWTPNPHQDQEDNISDDGESIDERPSTSRTRRASRLPGRTLSNAFVFGHSARPSRRASPSSNMSRNTSRQNVGLAAWGSLPQLSRQATLGRNSSFGNLTWEDKEVLGGIEYRSLRLLLKIVTGYFFGLHIFGVLCLAPWIVNAPAKYQDYLAEQGQGQVWWAFYSSQTMISNLGFTLTPDSMIHFRDATWPMLVMTFLAYAGNTCYPILLRCVIWVMHKCTRTDGSLRQSLQYLLDHPRRCYTLLFPGNVTWVLFGILFVLNFVDTLLIVTLDLHTQEVTSLSLGPRILAALFQAASARHTGTATFNLAKVNPAVQLSLLVMMYVSVFPIALSVRVSNTYEERALGKYAIDDEPEDSQAPSKYLTHHVRNQLGFDLWYIFLGTFCICIAEAGPIKDTSNVAFNVFAVLFEVTSAYGNVGLSLGTNETSTSLSGDYHIFSKLVICAMMIRGRHRGLPYALDHAVMLPSDHNEALEYSDGKSINDEREDTGKILTRAKTV